MDQEKVFDKQKVQNISKRFSRNILFVQGISFPLIVIAMMFSTYFLKIELADQVARTIEGKMKRGDMREILNILSDAKTEDFVAVDLYNSNNELQLTFPTRFRRQLSGSQRLWHYLTQATYQKDIFFDMKGEKKAGTVIFTFGVFQFLPIAILVFVFGILVSYPFLRRHKSLLLDSLEKETIKRQNEAIEELARQVRHDYKSPLMAIKSVIDKSQNLKDGERKTLSVAYARMMSMLKDLSQENIQSVLKNGTRKNRVKTLTHIYSSILNVAEEKKVQYPGILSITDTSPNSQKGIRNVHDSDLIIRVVCSNDDKRAYILIDDVELQRVVSNLVENSIESIQGYEKPGVGEISILIEVDGPDLKIKIEDNGQGVPENLLEKIRQKSFSYGKKGGEGLGLYSSIKKIEGSGGSLKIQSTQKHGTTVTIELPKAAKPQWAVSELNLNGIEEIVILDDDESIHQIWANKLRKFRKQRSNRIVNFTHAKALRKQLHKFSEKTLFLLDYELRGQKETGLDVVEWVSQKQACYIVSNSFQDPKLQRECKKLGVGLFPKTLL